MLSIESKDVSGLHIARLILDDPESKVNVLGEKAMRAFDTALRTLQNMHADACIIVSGKDHQFIAGADIHMIAKIRKASEGEALSRQGQALTYVLEDCKIPIVAAIDGPALGGGCELALACRAMVASMHPSVKLGFPEVQLGLLPGMGGCIRLPRKVGLAAALGMLLTGKRLSGAQAHALGLVDALLPAENFDASIDAWVVKNIEKLRGSQRFGKKPHGFGIIPGALGTTLEQSFLRHGVLYKARKDILEKTQGHYPAPLEILQVCSDTHAALGERLQGEARQIAFTREARGFGALSVTEESQHLVSLFLMTERNKLPYEGRPVQYAAILGAGVMGGGIAHLLACHDIQVRMKDLESRALSIGLESAHRLFQKSVSSHKMTARQMHQKMNAIVPTLSFDGFIKMDVVIEAVVENLDVKKMALAEIESYVDTTTFLATNTSSLSVSAIQSDLLHPERLVGMHFFNPVHRMPLVEIIRGKQTSDEAVAGIFALAKRLGKTPIVVRDSPGFLVNRLLVPYCNEAVQLFHEGVSGIDQALESFGMPMGPLALMDEVGIDIGNKVAHVLEEAFGARMMPSKSAEKMLELGRLGRKSGKGFYEYQQGGARTFSPDIEDLLGMTVQKRTMPASLIIERCLLLMIHEAFLCLEEKVVASPEDIDIAMIMGTGFPAFRGGLLRYADHLGSAHWCARLEKLTADCGPRFQPSDSVRQFADAGKTFYVPDKAFTSI